MTEWSLGWRDPEHGMLHVTYDDLEGMLLFVKYLTEEEQVHYIEIEEM